MCSVRTSRWCCQHPYGFFSRWTLLQNWRSLRFTDHRGIKPNTAVVAGSRSRALVTRSRPLVVDPCCHASHQDWLTLDWSRLCRLAPYVLDYFVASSFIRACWIPRSLLKIDDSFLSPQRVARAFMPNATSAPGCSEADRNQLGDGSAEAVARVAQLKVTNMHKTVVRAIHSDVLEDPLGRGRNHASTRRDHDPAQCGSGGEGHLYQGSGELGAPFNVELLEVQDVTENLEEFFMADPEADVLVDQAEKTDMRRKGRQC